MHRRPPTAPGIALAAAVALTSLPAWAGSALSPAASKTLAMASAPGPTTPASSAPAGNTPTGSAPTPSPLRAAFDAAWQRQPEAQALTARRQAAAAQRSAASQWTPEAPALELATKTDRFSGNQGARELEVGVAVPLWLPRERQRGQALAEAEEAALDSRTRAAQLRLAAELRSAWWAWQRAQVEAGIGRDQHEHARRIAADVARRVQAGDLARADAHQADGALAAADSALAQAEAGVAEAELLLRALTGSAPEPGAAAGPAEAEPAPEVDPGAAAGLPAAHALLAELQDRANVAERAAALAATQSRANPELLLAATRERGGAGEPAGRSLTLALRLPLGAGPRHDARQASARAEAQEAQAQLQLQRERLQAERLWAQRRTEAARAQLVAAERRAELARATRGFFDKSFRLGETDLPTRLRIEAEAAEAERQAARSRIELAAAHSAWRQALGLLPQ